MSKRRLPTPLAAALALAALIAAPAATSLASAPRRPSVPSALQTLERSGAITPAVYLGDYDAYVAAKRSLARLRGTRRSELGAVSQTCRRSPPPSS